MKVAIQGEPGSFSHEAAEGMLPGCKIIPCERSRDVFDRLQQGSAATAVIPIENSLAGPVGEHLDLLFERDVFVQREFRLRIVHNLISSPGAKLSRIRQVYSHPVALDQCRNFFREYRAIRAVPFYDTAGSVKHVVSKKLADSAAIASARAAELYGGEILKTDIEDDKQNFTRFFLVTRHRRIVPGANKTSIAFGLRNVPGALFKALSVFTLRDLDLSKIESRPVRGRPWEYLFYVDFLAGDTTSAGNALQHLTEIANPVKVLGIYPAA